MNGRTALLRLQAPSGESWAVEADLVCNVVPVRQWHGPPPLRLPGTGADPDPTTSRVLELREHGQSIPLLASGTMALHTVQSTEMCALPSFMLAPDMVFRWVVIQPDALPLPLLHRSQLVQLQAQTNQDANVFGQPPR